MINSGNIGIGTEKVKDNPAEGNDIDGEFRILSSEGADEGGEHNAVAVALSCKNDDTFRRFFREGC